MARNIEDIWARVEAGMSAPSSTQLITEKLTSARNGGINLSTKEKESLFSRRTALMVGQEIAEKTADDLDGRAKRFLQELAKRK